MEVKVLTGSVKRITKLSVIERGEARSNERAFAEAEIFEGVFVVEVRLIYFVLNPKPTRANVKLVIVVGNGGSAVN